MRIHHATAKKAQKFGITLSLEDNFVVATGKDGQRLASGMQGNKVLEEAITKQTGHPAKGNGKMVKDPVDEIHDTTQAPIPTTEPAKAKKAAKPAKAKMSAKMSAKEKACRDAGYVKTRGGFKQEGDEEVSSEAKNWDELYMELIEAGDIEAEDLGFGVKHKYKELYKPHGGKCGDDLSFRISQHVENVEGGVDRQKLERFAKANDAWRPAYAHLVTKSGSWNGGMARMNVSNILRGKMRRAQKAGEQFEIEWA